MVAYNEHLQKLIELAVKEDIGSGDHSSLACFQDNSSGDAFFIAKEDGIIAGLEIACLVFQHFDPSLVFQALIKDGDRVTRGDKFAVVSGNKQSILTAERTVLNFMQRLSGISTRTNEYAERIRDFKAKVLDTRKTTPGFRMLEKQAVKLGGGENHRFGLYDMIMLKDNHIDFSGGIAAAIDRANQYLQEKGLDIPVEIEVRDFDELRQVLDKGGVQRIMLDNFTVKDTQKAVEMINSRFEVESSGGITLETIRDYAKAGVDYISVGALTHHIQSMDISLLVKE